MDLYGFDYGYGGGAHPYMYSDNTMNVIGGGILLSLAFIPMLYLLIAWIFRSIGLYHMAKNRGIAHAWFAWIPVLSQYILGRLINNKVVLGDDIVLKHASFFLPFFSFLSVSVFSEISDNPLVMILTAAVWVYNISALWRLFKIYRPQKRVSYTIWSIFLTSGFFIFAIRDDKPFDELEPNKIYENYYSGKQVLDHDLYQDKAEIRAKAREDQEKLKEEYRDQLNQPNLTDSQREEIRNNYYNERETIRRTADDQIRAENQEYYQDIQTLEEEVQDQRNPKVTIGEDGEPEIIAQAQNPETTEKSPEDNFEVFGIVEETSENPDDQPPLSFGFDESYDFKQEDEPLTPEEKELADSITETIDSINRISQDKYSQ